MDEVQRVFYEKAFELEFIRKRDNAFQDLFADIMERCYPGDFMRTRPWGRLGDRKNDGYLKSQRILYQVYAPNEMTMTEAINKIDEDFQEAIPYWEEFFDTWIFTHNSREGLGPHITQKLLQLGQTNSHLSITHCGFPELLQHFRKLQEEDLVALFGPFPSRKDVQQLRVRDIQVVLQTLARGQVAPNQTIRAVPAGKLAANALSSEVRSLLELGMIKTDLLRKFFSEYHDPDYGDELANTFREKYIELKVQNLPPDDIFWRLQAFVIGARREAPLQEIAVLTVLAYFFEACDIFEAGRVSG